MRKNIKTLCLSVLTGASVAVSVSAQEKPSLREGKNPAIEVTRINPSKGDIGRIERKRKLEGGGAATAGVARESQVHVVKLYVKMPPPQAKAYPLYIGDARIDEYGSFPEGIFFKAYDPKDLQSWGGKPVRFVSNNQVIDLGVVFPAKVEESKSARLPELQDVLKNN
jgi:hypothetical protein